MSWQKTGYAPDLLKGWTEAEKSLASALRRAVDLPDRDDPFIKDETRSSNLGRVVVDLMLAQSYHSQTWSNARVTEDKLEKIRGNLKQLRTRIASLDDYTEDEINRAGHPMREEWETARRSRDRDRFSSVFRAYMRTPYDQMVMPTTLGSLERFEAAIVLTIEEAIEASKQLPQTGRIPKYFARDVAYLVAKFMKDVTGSPPGLRTGSNPSGPFARALQEIFKIMNIKAGIQRPGEYAISKLSENSEF